MHAFDWVNTIADWLLSLVPRLRLIRSTHAGVLFCRGSVRELGAGLHLYWPIWSEIQVICVVRQTVNLRYQSLFSQDDVGVLVSVTVVYEIDNALKALTLTDDLTDTIGDLSQKAVKLVVSLCSIAELRSGLRKNRRSVDAVLLAKLAVDVREYGVRVVEAFIADIAIPRMLHIISTNN
jgi:regulator of protease activity HflC (stomatin/prohibitin superfamily)